MLNELIEYENTGTIHRERIINSFNGDDLAFQYMLGFRKFTAYLNPFLPMNIISRNPQRVTNGVFGNKVYGGDSEGFDVNPSSDEFRLCNIDEWRSLNGGGPSGIHGYDGDGNMVIHDGLKGCLDHRILRSSTILSSL
nr:hypothetical protein [Tanacetum cinerariifolium]